MSDASSGNSVEAWVLMALVYRDLDDFDYDNALVLAERLYALEKDNEDYRFLYAKCLFVLQDYTASYRVLKNARTIPSLNLFAKSCLELGKLEENVEGRRYIWNEGAQALITALNLYDKTMPNKHFWGDDLASVTTRTRVPCRASLLKLMGELSAKVDNINASSKYLFQSLTDNAFKLSAYNLICDIAPDVPSLNAVDIADNVFKDLPSSTSLERSPDPFLPGYPIPSKTTLHTATKLSSYASSDTLHMPFLRDDFQEATLQHLRALVSRQHQESVLDVPRGEIELAKDERIAMLSEDIRKDSEEQSYKNKHGLHKRPAEDKPQKLQVQLSTENLDAEMDVEVPSMDKPPRPISPVFDNEIENRQDQKNIKERLRRVKKQTPSNTQSLTNVQKNESSKGDSSLLAYFNINQTESVSHGADKSAKEIILKAMNNILHVIKTLATGYFYQSFHQSQKAVLELQRLDDQQYDTPSVLYLLGKAYYDVSNYKDAVVFFRRGILVAPWFCKGVPLYSTCLWYLEKERELNLLAYMMKGNRSHLYEAYIAAGNWSKNARAGNEALKWFQKAVELDPSRSYGHHLLGYEETEKENWIRAKVHFANCIIADRRSYLGWVGMATAYQGMQQYAQAKALLQEALRLHPYNPVVLELMAQVLLALHEYQAALDYARRSLDIRHTLATEKLIDKIAEEMRNPPLDTMMSMDEP